MNDASHPKPRVILIAGRRADEALDFSSVEAAGFVVERRYELENTQDERQLVAALRGAWAVVAGGEPYSRTVLEALPGLRLVARVGVGYDRVDIAAATALGKLVTITPGTIERAVAEFTVALILAARRKLVAADHAVRSGQWQMPDILSTGLIGATVGLVGLGRIGGMVARRLAGFECRLVGTDPVAYAGEWRGRGVELIAFEELLEASDVVSLHLPLTPGTRHLIGAPELARMRKTAVLVNTSRGGLVDETALVAALAAGQIGGAGLDVYEEEPLPAASALLGFSNVVLSGHVAWATHGAARASAQRALDCVLALARGEMPEGALNPQIAKSQPLAPLRAR
jgi:phosphoglycerate dehydrogenase-like enzyme